MSPTNQTLLSRVAIAFSVFALVAVAFVASTNSGSNGQGVAAAGPVDVALSEFAISPATITVPKGGSLNVTNNGTMVHNLAVTGTPVLLSDLAAGASAPLDLSSLDPGTYEIFCAIPGHKDSGMTATLVITDGSGGGGSGETASGGGTHAGHDIASLNPASDEAGRIKGPDVILPVIGKIVRVTPVECFFRLRCEGVGAVAGGGAVEFRMPGQHFVEQGAVMRRDVLDVGKVFVAAFNLEGADPGLSQR